MKQWGECVVVFWMIAGLGLLLLEDFSAWGQADEPGINLLTITHGGQDDALSDGEDVDPGAFTAGSPTGDPNTPYDFQPMKLRIIVPSGDIPECESGGPYPVNLTLPEGVMLLDTEGEETIDDREFEEDRIVLVKATQPSQNLGDIVITATCPKCGEIAKDAVNATAVSIEWIDEKPDYTRDPAEYQEGEYNDHGDSDNFFLRHLVRPRKDDGTPDYSSPGDPDYQDIDLWYRIMPEDLREREVLTHVQITIYREDTSEIMTTIAVDQDDRLEELNEEQVYHVVWDGADIRNPVTGEFSVAGFYRVQLEAEFDWGSGNGEPVTLLTSIEDGDEHLPDWQCPQDGLAIHDLAFKHRPDVWVGSGEVVTPNGPGASIC